LGVQIEYLNKGVFVHQEAYIMKVLKRFYVDKSYSMVVGSLDVDKSPFLDLKKMKNFLVLKYHILVL